MPLRLHRHGRGSIKRRPLGGGLRSQKPYRDPCFSRRLGTSAKTGIKGCPALKRAKAASSGFSCGACLACDKGWALCPDGAVLKTDSSTVDGSHCVFDDDGCKGCGLCAHECPCGDSVMAEA